MLGFIGFGEAGFELAKGLTEEGVSGIVAFDPMLHDSTLSKQIKNRAEEAEVQIVDTPSEVLRKVDTVFVAVPAQYTLDVCDGVRSNLNEAHLYIDVSAARPDIKKKVDEIVTSMGGQFVDAAMLGPLTVHGHKVLMLASGSGAYRFKEGYDPLNMNIKLVGEQAGDASAIKLLRSIYMKGTASLLVEVLEAARALRVEDEVIESLKETIESTPFDKTVDQLVTGTSIHSERRAFEIEGSVQLLENLGLDAKMATVTKEKLNYITNFGLREAFNSERPKNWQIVVDKMEEKKRVIR
ncbi:NAD(P)-dependent oxidoreductase [Oceanobacillus polygoni]|uniref:3-hydroxyisobutyrate dehydrogenase-like beta-hydroxyacid dehydrogenase n=1 Tax=Oceanobacillus polygoni TaxID=1235259 RepID=A0A9X0YRW4_9BACI|nr:NAD(P)-dependent oxidoreductase [Oceanobacillus polygoni]MBP2076912.1 3-hydroxyisobutyrate dehydrogenase-like beta-hydroxyacid dehydrogenase [Oceanobacillus polygoni]